MYVRALCSTLPTLRNAVPALLATVACVAGALVVAATPVHALPLTLAGFGDSITCTTCNDGSYLGRIGAYLPEAPIVDDNGISSDLTSNVLARLDTWLTDGNTADWVIILSGTPDTYQAVGGFNGQDYSESETVGNISDMLDLVIGAGIPVVLVAPPATEDPCGSPVALTCTTIDGRLAALSSALETLAGNLGIPFVDIYDAFVTHPSFGVETPGDPASLLRSDGLHPQYATGDDLIAFEIAAVIPEPSTALLVASGLALLGSRRRRLAQR